MFSFLFPKFMTFLANYFHSSAMISFQLGLHTFCIPALLYIVITFLEVLLFNKFNFDIDSLFQKVIEVSKKFLPFMAKGFESPKLTVHIGDGAEFVKNQENEFDVIITDSSDPKGMSLWTILIFLLSPKHLAKQRFVACECFLCCSLHIPITDFRSCRVPLQEALLRISEKSSQTRWHYLFSRYYLLLHIHILKPVNDTLNYKHQFHQHLLISSLL